MIGTIISMLYGAGENNAHKQGGESGFGTARSFEDALDPLNIFGGSSSSIGGNIIDPGNVMGANPQLSANGNPRVNGGNVPGFGQPGGGMGPMTGGNPGLMSAYASFLRNLGAPPMQMQQPQGQPRPMPGPARPAMGGGGMGYPGMSALSRMNFQPR